MKARQIQMSSFELNWRNMDIKCTSGIWLCTSGSTSGHEKLV